MEIGWGSLPVIITIVLSSSLEIFYIFGKFVIYSIHIVIIVCTSGKNAMRDNNFEVLRFLSASIFEKNINRIPLVYKVVIRIG